MRTLYRNTLYLALALLAICLVVNLVPDISSRFPIKKGLDLAGGTRAVLQMKSGPGTPPLTRDVQNQVVQIMTARVNGFGISEAMVQAKGSDQIIVEMPQMPGKSVDEQRMILHDLIQPAKLEFIWLKEVRNENNPAARYIYEGDNRVRDADTNKYLTPEEVQSKILYNDPADIIVTGADLQPNGADVNLNTTAGGGVETTLKLNERGTRQFAAFTRDHIHELLAIVLNGTITQAPRINDAIENGEAVITGGTNDVREAKNLANLLNAGALPVPLEELSSSSVEATLGENAMSSAVVGGIIGILAVMLFMLAVYFLPGAVAVGALIIYAFVTFTIFRLLHVTLTLPGIAGFILSIGMAVDANILIFERMKEEMRAGRTLHAAVDAGFERAWTSIRDSNIATLITCAVLGYYPGPIRGFAIVLALGVIISLFTAVTVSRALLHIVVNQEWAHNPAYFRIGDPTKPRPRWDIMGRRPLWYSISFGLILLGWAFNGIHYKEHGTLTRQGIDFTGGSMITYGIPADKPLNDNDVKAVFTANGLPESYVQRGAEQGAPGVGGAKGTASNLVNVRTRVVTDAQLVSLEKAMKARFGDGVTQKGVDRVGPVISKELTHQAFMMIIAASVLILLYLAYAFGQFGFKDGLRYGSAATVSMLHDVMFMFGFMGFAGYFFHWELNSLFVTAALTIIGFTNHDTIVVFDRIRENAKLHKDLPFSEVANMAIVQTLGRSVYTSLTVILTLAALLFFGTKGSLELKVFTSVLLVGVTLGVYSSIFFATPVLAWFEERKRRGEATQRQPSAAETRTFTTPQAPKPAAPAQPVPPRSTTSESLANGESADRSGDTTGPRPAAGAKKAKRRF